MASIKAGVKTVKAQVLKMLQAGLDSQYIAKVCNVSPTMVKEWEEAYLRDILSSGAGQRARLRNVLMRNSPQMINVVYKLAMQDIDSKMQMSAATTYLNFASRFFKEDASIAQMEAKAHDVAKGNIEQTLFDFVIPGETKTERPNDNEQGELFAQDEEDEEGLGEDEDHWELTPEDLENSATSTNSDE
jgi:hypothetical protein